MTDLTRNHPAVEAAARAAHERAWCGEGEPWSEVDDLERDEWRADEAHSLTAALPHLTADDLRDTPVVRMLMAEGWEEGAQDAWEITGERWNSEYAGEPGDLSSFRVQNPIFPNPYLEGNA